MPTDTRTSELVLNVLSKQDYDNIPNPDPNQLYLVPEEEEHKPICYPTTADNVCATSMDLKSSVSDNGLKLTEVGFVYSDSNQSPTVSDTKVICNLGVGRIEKSLSGLSSNTPYYIRSYGINQCGTSYGNLLTESTINDYTPSDYNQFLQLWLKSDNALLINNKVKQWYDLSNNNFIIYQATESYMPALNSSAINNYPSLQFNGTSTYMNGGNILNLANNSWTWFIVVKNNSVASLCNYFGKTYTGAEVGRYGLSPGYFQYITAPYNVNYTVTYTAPVSTWHIITLVNDRNTLLNTLYLNNSIVGSGSFPIYNMQNSRSFLIGAYNGANNIPPNPNYYFNGEIAEIIAFNTVDETMRNNITQYLSERYNIPIS